MGDLYGCASMTSNDIRLLSAPEIPLLLPLARAFYGEGNLSGKLNDLHAVKTFQEHVERGSGFVLAGGIPIRGMIAGILFRDLATADLCCMEYFWYVDASARGSLGVRLLDAWEREASRRGAKRMMMAHMHSEKTAQFTGLYERRGYRMKEQIFVKEVGQ